MQENSSQDQQHSIIAFLASEESTGPSQSYESEFDDAQAWKNYHTTIAPHFKHLNQK